MKRPLKNTLSVAGADIASRVLGFAVTVYLGRVLGTEGFGLVGIGFAVLGYIVLLSSPGVHIIGVRDVAAGEGVGLAAEINSLRLVLAGGFVVLVSIGCLCAVTDAGASSVIVLIACSSIPLAISPDWFFQGKEQLGPVAASKVSMYVVYLALALVSVRSAGDVGWAAASFMLGNVAASFGLLVLFRTRFGRLRFTWSPSRWMKELKESFPVGLTSLLTQTVTNLPILIVGILLTTREAGAFNAAMKLVFFVLIIDRVFYAVFLPVISRQTKEAGSLFLGMVFLAVRVVLALTIPIAVIGMLLAPEIVNFVFGAGYAEAIPVLESLLPYVVFTLVNTVIMSALVAVNKQSEYLAVMGWGTGALVVLCVILTIVAGVNGTAMSLPLGEAVMTGMVIWKAGNALGPGLTRECAPAFGSGLVMAAAAFALRSVSPFLAVPAVLACFLGSLALLKGIRREDVSFLREKFV